MAVHLVETIMVAEAYIVALFEIILANILHDIFHIDGLREFVVAFNDCFDGGEIALEVIAISELILGNF